jgi:hypothetical protein
VCGASLSGAVKVLDSSGPVVLGDGTDECPASSFFGAVTVKGNTAGALTVKGNADPTVDEPNAVEGKEKLQ